jgi:hypothetical protein
MPGHRCNSFVMDSDARTTITLVRIVYDSESRLPGCNSSLLNYSVFRCHHLGVLKYASTYSGKICLSTIDHMKLK